MSFKDLNIQSSYVSKGEDNLAVSFLNPVLQITKEYKRSVGFFSSTVFTMIMDGVTGIIRNGGLIKLIASPKLSEEDSKVIALGYEHREKTILNKFTEEFIREVNKLDDRNLNMLYELIVNGHLDIKIAITNDGGIYHDKLGILKDTEGNRLAFVGSANSSLSAYKLNYEKIRIVKDWVGELQNWVDEEEKEFDDLWNGVNSFVEVYNYTAVAALNLIEIREKRCSNQNQKRPVELKPYQEEAINAWVKNNYHGFYVMATGTGKTWTAIFAIKRLLEHEFCIVNICVPYKHLVAQWSEDVEKLFPGTKIIKVSSENAMWEKEMSDAIIDTKYNGSNLTVITTMKSFLLERFSKCIAKYPGKKLLIVDEAHRFKVRPDNYDFMLGLSATPYSGKSSTKGNELMNYFGGQVYSLPIEKALSDGFLVKYYYHPIFVEATDDEVEEFSHITKTMMLLLQQDKSPDIIEKCVALSRKRLRVISKAQGKKNDLRNIVHDNIEEKDHLIVYCGDGKLYPEKVDAKSYIASVSEILSAEGYKASKFTANETMTERMDLVDLFNKGDITSLVAIRCLDEGINIPSIKAALILSSNDDYREFVQRRGRILRLDDDNGKEYATIYDVVVLPSVYVPSSGATKWAAIELRRFYEYGKLAINWNGELKSQFESYLNDYGLDFNNDINVFDYENMVDEMEVEEDE